MNWLPLLAGVVFMLLAAFIAFLTFVDKAIERAYRVNHKDYDRE